MTQVYGYHEVGNGLKDIKHIGNDYNRNRIRSAKPFSSTAQMPISAAMKSRLNTLAGDPGMPGSARWVIREYPSR
jgi:hypothetical protein